MGLKKLYLVTNTFPYGIKSETFLENEIEILSREVKSVVILPLGIKDGSGIEKQRKLPPNVSVDQNLILNLTEKASFWSKISLKILSQLIFFEELLKNSHKRLHYISNYSKFKAYLFKDLLYLNKLKRVLKNHNRKEDGPIIFYSYWFVKPSISIGVLRRRKQIDFYFSRAHGYDLYDDRWDIGLVPFRHFIAKGMDHIYTVSEFGRKYLLKKLFLASYSKKISTSYLGVKNQQLNPERQLEKIVIVSSGSLLDFKRTDLIPEVLGLIPKEFKWVHFGDGPQMNELKNRIPEKNVEYILNGHVDNVELIRFYEQNHVDLFISLSINEGLPVSIMEAISFGIPVVGMDIKAMSELINKESGLLLPLESESIDIASRIENFLNNLPDRKKVADYQRSNFSAEKNYSEFINDFKSKIDTE